MSKKFTFITFVFKEIKTKRNLIISLIFSLLFIILFIAITLISNNNDRIKFYNTKYIPNIRFEAFYNYYNDPAVKKIYNDLDKNNYKEEDLDKLTLELYKKIFPEKETDIEKQMYSKISDIDHVIDVVPRKYNREIRAEFADGLDENNSLHKRILIKPLQYKEDILLADGDYPNTNEIVCPKNMILTLNLDDLSTILIKNLNYSTKIGDTFEIYNNRFFKDNSDTSILKISGVYNNLYTHDSVNTCYTSYETFDKFNTSEGYETLFINGKNEIFYMNLNGVSVRIDNADNKKSVQKKIEDLGLEVFDYDEVTLIEEYVRFPIYIGIGIIGIIGFIYALFVRKSALAKKEIIGIMQTQGFSKYKIISLEIIQNSIIITITYFVACVLYFLIFKFAPYNLIYSYEVYGNHLNYPLNLIVNLFIIILCVTSILTIIIYNKYCNNNILNNLREDKC